MLRRAAKAAKYGKRGVGRAAYLHESHTIPRLYRIEDN